MALNVGVHLSYSAPGFQVLLDSQLYLPEALANDPARMTLRAEKNIRPRRDRVLHKTAACGGDGRPGAWQWCSRVGLEVRRVVRPRRQVPGCHRRAPAGVRWRPVLVFSARRLSRLDPEAESPRRAQRADRRIEILPRQSPAGRTESGHRRVDHGRSKAASAKGKRSWGWTTTKSAAGAACIGTFM